MAAGPNGRQHARGRSSPPPSGGSSGLARASPALFAQKVLIHHKHHRISTPPLRKPPLAQKALRALWPLARPCGLDQIRPPSKNASVFWGARTSPTRRRCLKARSSPPLNINHYIPTTPASQRRAALGFPVLTNTTELKRVFSPRAGLPWPAPGVAILK
jgi:hypothetical protein